MKYLVASDIHGSAFYCKKLIENYRNMGADRLLLLGDILYHGPRNELPKEYNPKEVIQLLNQMKNEIYAVRGNCDSEVDQMVLEFPILADYCILSLKKRAVYVTHGHIYNKDYLPPMKAGDILLHGHTHVWQAAEEQGHFILNPGSTSLPKEGNVPSYAILEEESFTIYDFQEKVITKKGL